jgi:uncharacterized BrkB/YihY/UPF0761 family membrane protein
MTIVFVSTAPPLINDGDELIVAGGRQGQVIKAHAYCNLSMHVVGDEGAWRRLAETLGCLLLSCLFFWLCFSFLFVPDKYHTTGDTVIGVLAAAAGLAFIVSSFYYFYRWLKVKEAVKMLGRYN